MHENVERMLNEIVKLHRGRKYAERRDAIRLAVKSGLLSQILIARKLKLSRQRVHQVVYAPRTFGARA